MTSPPHRPPRDPAALVKEPSDNDLAQLAQRLDAASAVLNARVEALEQSLVLAGVRVHASVQLLGRSILTYGRDKSVWGLYVTTDVQEQTPLRNASRELRLAAIHAFPALKQALAERMEKMINDLEQLDENLPLP